MKVYKSVRIDLSLMCFQYLIVLVYSRSRSLVLEMNVFKRKPLRFSASRPNSVFFRGLLAKEAK